MCGVGDVGGCVGYECETICVFECGVYLDLIALV